jgi:acylphosphatase
MDRKRQTLRIAGKVQGVFFRQSAVDQARSLGLTGWVRNLPDGQVEAVAEGDSKGLAEFVRWCQKGPANARVSNVSISEAQATGEYTTFQIEP